MIKPLCSGNPHSTHTSAAYHVPLDPKTALCFLALFESNQDLLRDSDIVMLTRRSSSSCLERQVR